MPRRSSTNSWNAIWTARAWSRAERYTSPATAATPTATSAAPGIARPGDSGFLRHVGEGAVSVVVIEVASIVGEVGFENVEPAVAVVIANRHAHASLLVSIVAVGAPGQDGDVGRLGEPAGPGVGGGEPARAMNPMNGRAADGISALPASVDLREVWWKINDQASTGSCVGWGTADGLLRSSARYVLVSGRRARLIEPVSLAVLDEAQTYAAIQTGGQHSAPMVSADTLDELHVMAAAIGLPQAVPMFVTVRWDTSPVTMLLAVTAPSVRAGTCHRPSVRAGAVLYVRAGGGRGRAESARAGSASPRSTSVQTRVRRPPSSGNSRSQGRFCPARVSVCRRRRVQEIPSDDGSDFTKPCAPNSRTRQNSWETRTPVWRRADCSWCCGLRRG